VIDPKKYLGMNVHDALAAASRVDERLRVMSVEHIKHRHSGDDIDPNVIQVWVKAGVITKAIMESNTNVVEQPDPVGSTGGGST